MLKYTFILVFSLFSATSISQENTEDLSEISTPQLQRELFSIESELAQRGISAEKKRKRLQDSTSRIKKLMASKRTKHAVIGSVIAAAVTAHPAGLLVGGLAGGMVGKSERYDEAEEALAEIEQEIIVDEDDFLTEGEVRLASFSGDSDEIPLDQVEEHVAKKYGLHQEGGEQQMLADDALMNDDQSLATFDNESSAQGQANGYQQMTVAEASGVAAPIQQYSGVSQTASNKPEPLDSCYNPGGNDRESRARQPHCFYMMY